MSTPKKLPPIQPAPFQRFTIRLVDGHFVRVPKVESLPATDATRPPAVLSPGAARTAQAAIRDGTPAPRGMRLVNGRFVRVVDLAADRSGEVEPAAPNPPPAHPSGPAAENAPAAESWAVSFGTRLDPSDTPSHP